MQPYCNVKNKNKYIKNHTENTTESVKSEKPKCKKKQQNKSTSVECARR